MEIRELQELTAIENAQPTSERATIEIHSRLQFLPNEHTKAITSIQFYVCEDELLTTSMDKSVRLCLVDSGQLLKCFTDHCSVIQALFLPVDPSAVVCVNSSAIWRLVDVKNGEVKQNLQLEKCVRSIAFDDRGRFLFAGDLGGFMSVFDAANVPNFRLRFRTKIARYDLLHRFRRCCSWVSSVSTSQLYGLERQGGRCHLQSRAC